MAVNKVIFGGKTLIDTSGVTVTAEKMLSGATALNAAGEKITGTYEPKPNYIAVWDTMLGNKTTTVDGGYSDEGVSYLPSGVLVLAGYMKEWHLSSDVDLIENYFEEPLGLIVVPRSVTTITEYALEECSTMSIDHATVIFLGETPPTMGWQGAWSYDGGCGPPYIYVPDASVNAYKAHSDFAEYVDLIYPISSFDYDEWYSSL